MTKPFPKLRGRFRHKRRLAAWSRGCRDGVLGHTSLTDTERIGELGRYSAGFKAGELDFFKRHEATCVCDSLLRTHAEDELDNAIPFPPKTSA